MTEPNTATTRIAIVGGGPGGLYAFKHIVATLDPSFAIDIFEAKAQLGGGMPYSPEGASTEHITNVSCNEIPPLVTPVLDWLKGLAPDALEPFHIDAATFSEQRVLPRLLFGAYLAYQFELLLRMAADLGIAAVRRTETRVTDIMDHPDDDTIVVESDDGQRRTYDYVVICTGHSWPRHAEGVVPGYFDSPYPPHKLAHRLDHAIAIRGSSLTAVDAVRTLARSNGTFSRNDDGTLVFDVASDAPHFRIVMHSRHGILPCVRFHTESPVIGKGSFISRRDVFTNMAKNDGFLSLDFVFDRNFKEPLREKDPAFYARIRDMTIEEFVAAMLGLREGVDPFTYFRREYAEAEHSILREEPIHWKEMLSALSFAMNYPAKHMSAEDMYRHKHVLMPLISIVIAFVPQGSCEELLALHDAGLLTLVDVGEDSHVEPRADGGASWHYTAENGERISTSYETFVDCIGQPHLDIDEFPFPSLARHGDIVAARLKFRSATEAMRLAAEEDAPVAQHADGSYTLHVPGIAINDEFQVVDANGVPNPRIYMMAVPYIGGFNPDYSGLDFCEEAGGLVVRSIARREDGTFVERSPSRPQVATNRVV